VGIEVSPVEGRGDLARFIELPYQLYQHDPYWVPPLRIQQRDLFNEEKHPFYKHSRVQHFLAKDGDRAIGRVSAIVDRKPSETGYFGFFECPDSEPVAKQLFHSALEWLAKNGVRRVLGPMNPSTNYECGLLVEGFDSSPQIMMTYNPPYYARLMEKAGLRKAKDLWAYGGDLRKVNIAKARRVAERSKVQRKLSIRQIRMKQFDAEVEILWKLYNSAWSRNWGFEPIRLDEFQFQARDLKAVVDPGLVLVGEVDGAPVGFALALPDINQALKRAGGRLFPLGLLKILYYQRKIRTMRVIALGVVEEHRTAGAAAAFYSAMLDYALGKGYAGCEFSWVLEDNILMNRSIEALGVQRYKTYRIYEWTQDYA
jgi:GNAT superfamily N-acetyltransferase